MQTQEDRPSYMSSGYSTTSFPVSLILLRDTGNEVGYSTAQCEFFLLGNRRQRNHDKHERDSEGRGGSSGAGGSEVGKPGKKKAKTNRK